MSYPTLLIRVGELLLDEGNGVEFVDSEEFLYFVEFVDEKEYLLAVQFEFEVSHAEVGVSGRPFHDAIVLNKRNALCVQPEQGVTPTETTSICL